MGSFNTKEINTDTFNDSYKSMPDYSLLVTDSKSYLEFKVLIKRFFTGAIVQQKKCISGSPMTMKVMFDQLKLKNFELFSNPLNFDSGDERDEILDIVNVKLYTTTRCESI